MRLLADAASNGEADSASDAETYASADSSADRASDRAADADARARSYASSYAGRLSDRPSDRYVIAQIDPVVSEFLDKGVLGLVIVALLVGFLVPKWVVDEYRKREAFKDGIIDRLTKAVEALEDEARRRGRG